MEAFAVTRYQRGSSKKLVLIANLIRGKDVTEALRTLAFLTKPIKLPVLKTLRSAVANAIQQAGKAKLHEEDLYVSEVQIDQGPTMKRWRPRARGMAAVIRKRTFHVRVRVATKKGIKV